MAEERMACPFARVYMLSTKTRAEPLPSLLGTEIKRKTPYAARLNLP